VEPYSQAIGRFVRGLSIDDVPQAVVDKAKLVLLDTIGVALASSTMQFGAMVTRVAQAFGGSPNRNSTRRLIIPDTSRVT
jgi:2-methylcitrate dehydratase PrpD